MTTTQVSNYWRSVKDYHDLKVAQGTNNYYFHHNHPKEKRETPLIVVIVALGVFLGIGKGLIDALTYRSHSKAVRGAQTALKDTSIANDYNSKDTIQTHEQIAGAKLANAKKFLVAATVFGTACLARTAVHSNRSVATGLNVAILASVGFSCLSSAWYAWTSPQLTETHKLLIMTRSAEDLRGPEHS
jgi:hypothetical protein